MPELEFATGLAGRPSVGLPESRCLNFYAEPTPGGPKKAVRIGRPGLTRQYILGDGPVARQFQNPGLFTGAVFAVSGTGFYRNDTLVGTIPYTNNPRMAATNTQLALVAGGSLYVYDGTTLALIRYFNDGESLLPPLSGVAVLYNIFVFPVAGTNQFYPSAAGDATDIDASLLSEAQVTPDPIVDVNVLGEELYFTKSRSTEIWDYNPITQTIAAAGGSEVIVTAPFQESQGRTYIRGSPAQGSCVTWLDNALFWVGDDLEVYRSSNVPQKISTPFIDDRLRAAQASIGQTQAFGCGIEGHWFYVMSLPVLGESYAYDCAMKEWAQWGTQTLFQSAPGAFIGGCSAGQGATIYVGSAIDGRVWLLDASNYTDDGATREVVATATIWVTEGSTRLNNVALACVRGVGNANAPNPVARMRLSHDGGRTFTSWWDGDIGPVGAYSWKAVWRALGLIQQPGCLLEFSILDPVIAAIEGGSWNAARP